MHKSCLRDWLVQQQTCPTCRGDISVMEARQRLQDARIALDQGQQPPQVEAPVMSTDDHDDDKKNDEGEDRVEPQIVTDGSTLVGDDSHPSTERTADQSVNNNSGAIEEMDKKPAASSTSRGKRVRIAPQETGFIASSYNGSLPFSQRFVFPAFYKVVHNVGASVYDDVQMISLVIRVVPFGVVVLGQEMAWRNCDGENQMMIRIPDGWVTDDQLERIVAVPFEYQG
jgi:hypothetical protein